MLRMGYRAHGSRGRAAPHRRPPSPTKKSPMPVGTHGSISIRGAMPSQASIILPSWSLATHGDQVNAYISGGILTDLEGIPLIDSADAIWRSSSQGSRETFSHVEPSSLLIKIVNLEMPRLVIDLA